MQRRNFIKNALYLGCMGVVTSGCNNLINYNSGQNILRNDKFIYKSKQELPKKILLEACSLCQLDCPECKVRKLEKYMPKDWLGYLKFEDFKSLVDDNYFKEIELSHKGEIFLNPELDEIIKYAFKKQIILQAHAGVNLNTVSDLTLKNLVKYKFNGLTVSIDGATPEVYALYRKGGDFNTVIKNIKKINYFKEKYNSQYPKMIWQFIPFGHNEHEIELAKQKANELNMQISFIENHSPDYSPVVNKELVEKQTGLKLTKEERDSLKHQYESKKQFSCYCIFNYPQIDYNGNLTCHSKGDKYFSANVFKDGYFNALNSDDFVYAKHMLTNLAVPPKDNVICTKCPKYKFLKKENLTLPL